MDLQIKGRTALVTGSTAGIGRAIAKALAAEGATVLVNGRNAATVQATLEALRAELGASASLIAAPGDLGTAAGCDALLAAHPEVDILVNNLGIFEPKAFEDIPDADWTRFFEVNVMSGVRLSRHYLPRMKAANWGRIVFISSESGLCPPAEMVHYGVSKTAQLAVARGMAETTAGTGVTVNSVLPGPTRTEGVEDFFGKLAAAQGVSPDAFVAQFFKEARPTSILQRLADPAEVAAVVAFVCSAQAAVINGAAVRAEGGVVRCIG
jgi:NAD(P)-dependent dehydrogenase (short-subunit alcohol dehydrogenase family)